MHWNIYRLRPFLLRVILWVPSQLYLFQQKKIPNALLNTVSRLRVISSIITILFVKREGLKMTAASILNDVSEWNVGLHYQMVLLSEVLQSLSNIAFSEELKCKSFRLHVRLCAECLWSLSGCMVWPLSVCHWLTGSSIFQFCWFVSLQNRK